MVSRSNILILFCFSAWFSNTCASITPPVAIASSSFDWSTFAVSSYPLGSSSIPVVTWSNQYTALVSNDFTEFVYDWNSSVSNTSGTDSNWTQTTVDQFSLNSYVQDSDPFRDNSPSSYSYRYGNFSVAGSGILIFSVDYSLFSFLVSGSDWLNFADAGVSMFANKISSNHLGQSFSAADSIHLNQQDETLNPAQRTGTLNLALVVNDGDYFDFTARNNAYAATSSVPLPSSIWTFFLGAISIFRRNVIHRLLTFAILKNRNTVGCY